MRSWSLLAVCTLVCGCNSVTGIDKYVVDLVDGGAGAKDGSVGTDSSSSTNDGSGPGPQCPADGGIATAECSASDLAQSDHTAPNDPRVISAPSNDNESPYVPNCMTIRAGQSVTFKGNLARHPVIPRANSTQPNPISFIGSEASVKFDCPGDFNFSCRTHGDNMLGTIRVIP